MIHNLVKYFVQNRLRLWDIKITNFKLKSCIFISHKRSRFWTRYFTRLCIIISSICVIFLVNLDDFFAVICTGFHEDYDFHPICSLTFLCMHVAIALRVGLHNLFLLLSFIFYSFCFYSLINISCLLNMLVFSCHFSYLPFY